MDNTSKRKTSKAKHFSIISMDLLEDEIGPVIHDERQTFLYAAAEHREILLAKALRTTVYSKVRDLPSSYWDEPYTPAAVAKRIEIRQLTRSWAARFNLEVDWVIQEARNAINFWQCRPDRSNPFMWRSEYGSPPSFDWPVWLPQSAGWYRARVLQDFTDVLEAYIAACEKRYRDYKPPTIRARKTPVEERYAWTALRVCCRWGYERIAGYYAESVSPQNIGATVRGICRRINLPLPKVRPQKK